MPSLSWKIRDVSVTHYRRRAMSAVVLFGATGSIGRAIAAELVRRGHQVTGVSRRGAGSVAGLTPAAGDASSAADVARLAAGADVVISATGPRRDGSDPA